MGEAIEWQNMHAECMGAVAQPRMATHPPTLSPLSASPAPSRLQVSCHRYHHLHCETPLDPHSVYEGFWWSHMGWLLDDKATQSRISDTSNAGGELSVPASAHGGGHAASQPALTNCVPHAHPLFHHSSPHSLSSLPLPLPPCLQTWPRTPSTATCRSTTPGT